MCALVLVAEDGAVHHLHGADPTHRWDVALCRRHYRIDGRRFLGRGAAAARACHRGVVRFQYDAAATPEEGRRGGVAVRGGARLDGRAHGRRSPLGYLRCPQRTRQGHQESAWFTPRNPAHVARLRRAVDHCEHVGDQP